MSPLERALRVDTLEPRMGSEKAEFVWNKLREPYARVLLILPISRPGLSPELYHLGHEQALADVMCDQVSGEFRSIELSDDLVLIVNPVGKQNRLGANFYATRLYENLFGAYEKIYGQSIVVRLGLLQGL